MRAQLAVSCEGELVLVAPRASSACIRLHGVHSLPARLQTMQEDVAQSRRRSMKVMVSQARQIGQQAGMDTAALLSDGGKPLQEGFLVKKEYRAIIGACRWLASCCLLLRHCASGGTRGGG